jgi:hypothetical protein
MGTKTNFLLSIESREVWVSDEDFSQNSERDDRELQGWG